MKTALTDISVQIGEHWMNVGQWWRNNIDAVDKKRFHCMGKQ